MEDSRGFVTRWISALKRNTQLFASRSLKTEEIGSGQLAVLLTLYRHDGVSQEALAKHLFLDKANVTRAVSSLETEGLVYRVVDKDDQRKKLVYLTEKAAPLRASHLALMENWNDILLKGLSAEEKEQVLNLLIKMNDNAREYLKVTHEIDCLLAPETSSKDAQ